MFMTLNNAKFCLDCSALHTDKCCPVCASKAWVWLSKWLGDREDNNG